MIIKKRIITVLPAIPPPTRATPPAATAATLPKQQ